MRDCSDTYHVTPVNAQALAALLLVAAAASDMSGSSSSPQEQSSGDPGAYDRKQRDNWELIHGDSNHERVCCEPKENSER